MAASSIIDVATGMVTACGRGDFAAATENFEKTLAAALSEFMLNEMWNQIVRKAGRFKQVKATRGARHVLAPVRAVFVTCQFERMEIDVEMSFTPDDRIGGIVFTTPGLE
jgi:hypothetical protein